MHGGRLFPPPQNIRAPPYAGGRHASRHDATLISRVCEISGKIAVWVVVYSIGCPRGIVLMQVLVVWMDHVTIEIGLPDVVRVVCVYVIVVMMQWITARDCRGGNRDWMLGVVWSGEHGFVDVIRVL